MYYTKCSDSRSAQTAGLAKFSDGEEMTDLDWKAYCKRHISMRRQKVL